MDPIRTTSSLCLTLALAALALARPERGEDMSVPGDSVQAASRRGEDLWRGEDLRRGEDLLRFVVTGPTAGYLVPCGCSAGMKGGIAKRPAVLEDARAAHAEDDVIVVDCGDLVGPLPHLPATPREPTAERLKFDLLAQALAQMPYDVLALGDRDLVLPSLESQTQYGLAIYKDLLFERPPILTNVVRSSDERPNVARSFATLERQGHSLLFLSILEREDPRWHADHEFQEPVAAARASLRTAREAHGDFDLVVCIYHGRDEESMRTFLRAVPEIGLLLDADGSREPDEAKQTRREGGCLIVRPGDRGRYALTFGVQRDGNVTQLVELAALPVEETEPEAENLKDIVERYRELARTQTPPLHVAHAGLIPPRLGVPYVGSSACQRCHPEIHAQWHATAHAHALATLEKKGAHQDPECIVCHAVGYGSLSGFLDPRTSELDASLKRDLAGVGCESCHGPGFRHVLAPKRHPLPAPTNEHDRCTRCHDQENSPKFIQKRDEYREKIRHW